MPPHLLLRESNLIEGIDNPMADRAAAIAWQFLATKKKLSSELIRELHKMLTSTQHDLEPRHKGVWRPIQVYIGDYTPPAPAVIASMMTNWVRLYETWTPKEGHIKFEAIHPFVDGNGRTGRLLMWWDEQRRGQPLTELSHHNRREYYAWFTKDRRLPSQADLLTDV